MVYRIAMLLLLSSCATLTPSTTVERSPQLITAASLPPLPSWFQRPELVLEVKVYVANDGSVKDVAWLMSSGDKSWDQESAARIMEWKYSPAIAGGKPIGVWVRQQVRVTALETSELALAEIACGTRELADSVYDLLKSGTDFGELARQFSVAPSSSNDGVLGLVKLASLSTAAQRAVVRLREEAITLPVEVKGQYVIYKRLRKAGVSG